MLFRSCSGSRRSACVLPLMMFVAGLVALAGGAHAAPNLTLDFSGNGPHGSANVGDTVTVSIIANEIPAGTDSKGLFGFGFDLSFDPSLVAASPATAGPLWALSGFSDSSSTASSVGLSANRFFQASGPSGSGILLATIDLLAQSAGVSSLELSWYTGGPGDNSLFDGTVLDGSASFFVGGSLEVIPEPSSALLIGLGLAGLTYKRRKR
jgi:hypothetical protein